MATNNPVLPSDQNNKPIQLAPATTALATTVDTTIDSSTQVTFNASTTFVRVYATVQDVYLKWGTTAVTSSNFDEVVPAGQIIDLLVPISTTTGVKYTACTVISRTAGAAVVVIEK